MKYIVTGIIFLIVGVILGNVFDPYLPASISNARKGYQAGFDDAKAIVENTSIGSTFKVPSDVHSIIGTVTAMNGTQISFHSRSVSPFSDPSLVDRTITLDASTIVTKMVLKNQQAYLAELGTYQKAVKAAANGAATTTPPSPYTVVPASVADIKAGDLVSVSATENIAAAKEFTASNIVLLPSPITP